ncbi:SGNH hydrolase-type esterase domain-containing protein [Aspergillus egyptiacus]|nr:SGNH hydrolase-type esterase domain-containing protein [Aspergillus egyptiacus]
MPPPWAFRYTVVLTYLLLHLNAVIGHVVYGRANYSGPIPDPALVPAPRPLERRQSTGDVPLRILPLGASITWGLKSETGNGYRKYLRDQLRYVGWDVNMVGSKSNPDSTMVDKDVEAHSGDTIDMVHTAARQSLAYKPNIVLINAGTNDCRLDEDIPNASARMRSLIETLVQAEDMSETLIVLSTLIPSGNQDIIRNLPAVNQQYRDLVRAMREQGVSIVLAEMDRDDGWISYPEDYADDTHPNEGGYAKMAAIWYQAIRDAAEEDLIVAPTELAAELGGGNQCEKEYGNGIYGGETQRGSGEEDGIYYHESEAMGEVYTLIGGEDDFDRFFFARIFSRDRDDLLRWTTFEGNVRYKVYPNVEGQSTKFSYDGDFMTVWDNCNPAGVHWIDINGDGLDDFVCIAKDGAAYASVNKGNGYPGEPPDFEYRGLWKSREGYDQANVRLGDVDGDGRADYCVAAGNGDITCWRNGWIEDMPEYWQPLGKRFTGKGMGDLRGVRFEDINGDGRDDWLWVDDDGQTTTYTNARSCQTGEEGDGLNIVWRPGYAKGASAGPTHYGMSGFATSGLRNRVHFARVYGEPQDFGLLGRQDYVFVDRDDDTLGPGDDMEGYIYRFRVWKNKGSGGTKIKADGNRYCNMMGHDDGRMDYVWILSKGDMRIYPNKGLGDAFSADGPSYWGPNYVIFDPAHMSSINRDLDRRDLHLIDWDGDGACDIVWTDPDDMNRPHLFRNRIKEDGDFNWEYMPTEGETLHCPEKRGLGFFDRPVAFADISGNGLADYLCLEPDGRTWGWVHNDNGWEHISQFKFSEAKDRANLHWADVNGDGRADLIHTNKFNGDGTVWYNRGREEVSGSQFRWEPAGVKYEGAVAGSCTYFPDLDGDGRADMHSITHSMKNTGETWYNRCGLSDATGDDPGGVEDPNLPVVPEAPANQVHLIWDTGPGACSDNAKSIIYEEAIKNLKEGGYYDLFFPEEVRNRATFERDAIAVYQRMRDLLIGQVDGAHVTISCDNTRPMCNGDEDQDELRSMVMSMTGRTQKLNVCQRFFNDLSLRSTRQLLRQDGLCKADKAARNADTWAFVAAGVYFTKKSGRRIPLPELPAEPSEATTAATCIQYNDYLLMDWVTPGYRVDGYVAFGDSYSAGMGTGSTTWWDGCRVGSNNYPTMLFEQIRSPGVSMEAKMCSGDTITGFQRQIREWRSSSTANIGTVTLGGNDLGFSDLVWNCVITPNTAHFGSYYRQECLKTQDKARQLMQDTGAQGLRSKLKEAYKSILAKSSTADFHLFVASYIGFFNQDTTDCGRSTFHFWWGAYNPPSDWWANRIVYLTRDLRRELNDLVAQLNGVIEAAVNDAYREWGRKQVHYVNVQEKFNQHRWCEQGVHEPDSSQPTTYFFLSGWDDLPFEDHAAVSTTEDEELAAIKQAGEIELPDPSTCAAALGTDPDPYAVAKCRVAIAVEEDPDGPWAQTYRNATEAIARGDYSSQHISRMYFTSQIKTFHPRTPGMGLYRDAILAAMEAEID